MAMKRFSGRSARVCAAAIAALISLHAAQGLAADAAEPPYDPPVGSRWIILSEANSDEVRPDGPQTSLIKSRAELTIDAKTAEGFQITYVNRGTTVEGNARMLPLVRSSVKALENVPIRATTDLAGKPVRVDNLDEAKAAMRNMAGSLTAQFQDKPQVLALLNQMISGLIEVDAGKAASAYIEDVPTLAKAQNTGMKPGEVRRTSKAANNPLGGGELKSNDTFEMTEADATTGRLKFVDTTSYDAASMKDFLQSLGKRVAAASGDSIKPEQIDSLLGSMVFSLDERTEFEVEDGMTRKVSEKSVTVVRALGHNLSKTETKTVTVTRAP
jgi:hypothetical protein